MERGPVDGKGSCRWKGTYKAHARHKVHVQPALPRLQIRAGDHRHLAEHAVVEHQTVETTEARQRERNCLLRDGGVGQVAGHKVGIPRIVGLEACERGGGAGDEDQVVGRRGGEQVFCDGEAEA
jgi:hypothetical protein